MASTEENTPSGVAQSECWRQSNWDAVAWPPERFKTDILSVLLNWNSFVKRNGPKITPDHCAGLIRNYRKCLLKVLLPKEGQSVIKSKGSHTFPTLHCECLHGVFNDDMKTYNCLCFISLSRLCLSVFCDLDEDHVKLYDQFMQKSRWFTYFFLPL